MEMSNLSLRHSDFKIPAEIILAGPKFIHTRTVDLLIGGAYFATCCAWTEAGEMKLTSSSHKYRAMCNLITNQQLHNEIDSF